MKFNLSCAVYFTCLASLFAQTRYDINLISEGRLRESIVVKPSGPPPIGGYPIVFMLHGTNQDGEYFYDISGWKELGEQENFITVFPTSLRWCYLDDGIETYGSSSGVDHRSPTHENSRSSNRDSARPLPASLGKKPA